MIGVSFVSPRRMKNLEDFYLASRSLSAFLVFLTLAASWLGAASTLVSVDEASNSGVSSFWIMGMPAVLTVLVFFFALARPIRRLPILTLPDLVEMRYGSAVRHLAAFLIVWYMVLLAASQMVALGRFLSPFLGISYLHSLLLGTAVVLLYTVRGGFRSVVLTDGLQFFLLVVGLIGLFIFLSGGVAFPDISALAAQTGRTGYFDFFFDIKKNLLITFSFTLAWIISPLAWQRIQAARGERQARLGLLTAAAAFSLLYGLIVLIGLLSSVLLQHDQSSGPLLAVLISERTGLLLGAVVFVAVVAAVMSTLDSAVNTGALSLTRDIFQRMVSPRFPHVIALSRISTLIVGGLALMVATRFESILKTLGLASEIMAEGMFIPGVAMLYLKRRLPVGGLLSLLLGGGYAFFGFLCQAQVIHIPWPEWPHSVPLGVGLCLAGFVLGAAIDLTRNPAGMPPNGL